MAAESPITKDDQWHRFEHKSLTVPVLDAAGAPVVLTSIDLAWKLLNRPGGTVLLTKLSTGGSPGITVTTPTNVARIEILQADYSPVDLPAIQAGPYYHELWDSENDLMLCYGDAHLLEGTLPP